MTGSALYSLAKNPQDVARLRKEIETLTTSPNADIASLAKAVIVLNDSLQQHMARIVQLEKDTKKP